MKNPFLSMWLSAANRIAGTARGAATAEVKRQVTAATKKAAKPATTATKPATKAAKPATKAAAPAKKRSTRRRKSKA